MNKATKLKKAAEAVKYEIVMFKAVSRAIWKPNLDQFQTNILLESFVIHAYNLYRFFYQGEIEIKNKRIIKRKDDDIIAEDFNINRQQFRKDRTPKKNLKIIEEKRHKQLAHLTYNRIYRDTRTKGWKVGDIYKKLEKTMTAFSNSLLDENKKLL